MQVAARPFVYFAILLLALGLLFHGGCRRRAAGPTIYVKVRCAWPAGDTSHKPWYVEDIGGAEDERQEVLASGRCVGVQAF